MRRNWSGILLACALFLSALGASAQGSRKQDIVFNRFGQPVSGATITVCTAGATGSPCSPLAAIYSNVGLTTAQANPFSTDGLGNYNFYAAPGRYQIQFSGAGLTTTTIPDVILPCDPSNCSASSINVTNGISAFSLSLSGNLAVSGSVTTGSLNPASISTPQGGAAPAQLGPHWYPGTATGQCTAPAQAPVVALEGATGGSIGTASLKYEIAYFNRNGQTTVSPVTTFAAPSGATNRVLVQVGSTDYTFRNGCYGYRVYASSDGGATYWLQTAWTLPTVSFASLSRSAGGVVSAVTSATHGFIPGEQITVSGVTGGATNFNGTFILIGQQMSTPTTLFWKQAGATESANAGTGTGTVIAGLGADSQGHFVPGDFILSSIATSGVNPPGSNTATIDPLQVALNATSDVTSAGGGTNGMLMVPAATSTLTTPLIVSNAMKIVGAAKMRQGTFAPSRITSTWLDQNLGTVMVLGTANATHIEGVNIDGQGNGLMMLGWGPGFGNQNQLYRSNSFATLDATGIYAAVRVHAGTFYNIHFEDNYCAAFGGPCWQFDGANGAYWFLSGSRLDSGTNTVLFVSGPTDPDRGTGRGSFPNAIGSFSVRDLFTEQGTGIQFDAINMGLRLRNVDVADPTSIANTPAIIRLGCDANCNQSGINFGVGSVIEDTYFQANANYTAAIRVEANSGNNVSLTIRNMGVGATNFLDCNSNSFALFVEGPSQSLNLYQGATSQKLLNCPTSLAPNGFGAGQDGTTQTRYAAHRLPGGILFHPAGGTPQGQQYLVWNESGGNTMNWFGADPAVATNKFLAQSFSGGGRLTLFKNDGATSLFDANASSGTNTVSTGAPITINGGAQITKVLQAQTTLTFGAIAAQTCGSQTVTLTGSATSNGAFASPNYAVEAGISWSAFVSASNTVTVRACNVTSGSITPAASSNWRVWVVQE